MNRIRSLVFVPVVAWFCAANVLAAPRTFVSAANGNDANPCSRPLPCRNFAAALLQTDLDGQVIVLDSGGYGVVTINKAVSLISPNGVYGGITALSGNAVNVNAGVTGPVVLRNLSLNALGVTNAGIHSDTVTALSVENCVINGFDYGIRFDPTNTGAVLFVSNTDVRRSSSIGIGVIGGTNIQATIDSVRLQQNSTGVLVSGAVAAIRQSVTSGVGNPGFWAASGSKVTVENSLATRHSVGFNASGGSVMTMTRCEASLNDGAGIQAGDADTKIYVSDSTITVNNNGVFPFLGGVIISRGNNTLQANMTNGVFSTTFNPD
jgi:parallel beta helix pectate lyase-like protein